MNRKIFFAFLALAFVAYLSSCSKNTAWRAGKPVPAFRCTLKDSSGKLPAQYCSRYLYNGVLPDSDTAYIELQVEVLQMPVPIQ